MSWFVQCEPSVVNGRRETCAERNAFKMGAVKVNGASSSSTVPPQSLPERDAPDGGEDGANLEMANESNSAPVESENDDHWSDWDGDEEASAASPQNDASKEKDAPAPPPPSAASSFRRNIVDNDLSALDIQIKCKEDDIDYFADMEPTISTAPVYVAESAQKNQLNFGVDDQEDLSNDGWNWDD